MAANGTGIGARVQRLEDKRFLTGRGRYTEDINRPGQLYAHFLRSPHAHARILSVDTADAKAASGVVAIYTGGDIKRFVPTSDDIMEEEIGGLICGWMIHSKDGTPMKASAHPALAKDVVRYVGDHVAVIVAETLGQAQDAAELIRVEYEVLEAVVDPATAQQSGRPEVHAGISQNTIFEWEIGDKAATEAAFSRAAHVTTIDLVNNRLVPNPMEARGAIGDYDPGEESFTLYTTSQNPHVARLILSAFVGLAPEHKLRVIAPDVGGGFGSKIFVYAEEVVCLWAARRLQRPVKWISDRSEAFLCDAHGRDHVTRAELATDAGGRITGLRVKTIANLGAYLSTFASSVPTYLYATLLSGQYAIPGHLRRGRRRPHQHGPGRRLSGRGRPEATFVVERLVEVTARELGLDPVEFRRRNFVKSFPHQTPVIMNYDVGDYDASLTWRWRWPTSRASRPARAGRRPQGKLRGIGYSAYIEACGIAPSQAVGSLGAGVGLWESAEVRVNPTGNIEVLTGSHSHGQGHETTFAQLVSDRLGVPIDTVKIVHGDTDKVQFGMGTYGSRSGAVGMSAISKALDKVVAKAKKVAGHVLEAAEGDIEFTDGKFTVSGTDKALAFNEVALQAYVAHKFNGSELEPGLKEGAFYDPTNFTFPAGVHVCEVEIDPETGVTTIERWTAVDDFGNVINPMIVEGQVHGGIAQGVGQALLEGAHYDETGQLVTASFMDYTMPRAGDLPDFAIGMTVTPCTSNPLGIKGCGEAGAIAAPPAVINAITDALGHENIAMPATPAAVWRAAQHARMQQAAE
jgi:carbon-monoxide dehydrogenase large subunit